jgi:hypothetical protein
MDNEIIVKSSRRRLGGNRPALLILASLVMIAALIAGCSKGYSRSMKLPEDSAIVSELGWAAVASAYARVKKSPDADSADIGLVRRGTVFRCTARSIDPQGQDTGGLWYKYSDASVDGWLHSGDLSVFSTEEQARSSAGT